MPYMQNAQGTAVNHVTGYDLTDRLKDGWTIIPDVDKFIAEKRAAALPSWAVAVPEQPVTIPVQSEPVKRSPGRPRKEVPSILNGE